MLLHNRVSKNEMKRRLYEETVPRITISFYAYAPIDEPGAFRDKLYGDLNALLVFGRVYVASEGINAQISVPENNFETFKKALDGISFLKDVRLNIAVDDDGKSFWVLKVKLRNKIVADGIDDPEFNMVNKGKYVDAPTFNSMAEDDNTLILDMRNHYEYEIGHFENALEIPSETFREQLPLAAKMMQKHKDKNIIMYCTGGIRCEKASAYMKHQGFCNVYHLEGGVIHYANRVKELHLPNKFLGKNFVFDGRLSETVGNQVISHCHQCGKTCDTHTNCANEGCHLLFLQCPECAEKYQGCCSEACAAELAMPESEKKRRRRGIKNGIKIFNKSRERMDGLRGEIQD